VELILLERAMRNPNSKIFVVRQYEIRRRASLAPSFFALQA
jgi:hypothetical protein